MAAIKKKKVSTCNMLIYLQRNKGAQWETEEHQFRVNANPNFLGLLRAIGELIFFPPLRVSLFNKTFRRQRLPVFVKEARSITDKAFSKVRSRCPSEQLQKVKMKRD